MEINLTAPDADVTTKKADMVAFLDNRNAERANAREARRTAMETVSKTTGNTTGTKAVKNTEEFWIQVTNRIKILRENVSSIASGGQITETEAIPLWNSWSTESTSLQTLLNDCTTFLPAFDVRKAQKEIDTLIEYVETTKQTMQPRKKFAFRNRPTGPSITNHTSSSSSSQSSTLPSHEQQSSSESSSSSSSSMDHSSSSRYDEDEHTIENLSNQIIFLPTGHFTAQAIQELHELDQQISKLSLSSSSSTLPSSSPVVSNTVLSVPLELATARRRAAAGAAGKDIRLLNLTNCTVIILDPLKALRVDGLTNCQVYTGPIAGSALLHRCESCIFMFAARQLRIHTSNLCDYYLQVMSHPIIEHCQRVRFAPYGLKYANSDQLLEKAGLLTPPRPDMWKNVDDFGWHRVQKSPNWDIVPLTERIGNQVTDENKGISKSLLDKQITIRYSTNTGEDINSNNEVGLEKLNKINLPPSTTINKNGSTTNEQPKSVMGNSNVVNSTAVKVDSPITNNKNTVADDDEL